MIAKEQQEFEDALVASGYKQGLREAARMLRTDGVLLSIIPRETKADHVVRFALAFADKIETVSGGSVRG